MELDSSQTSVRRIMKNDLGRRPYKIGIEPLLSNDQKIKRKTLQIGFEQIFEKKKI